MLNSQWKKRKDMTGNYSNLTMITFNETIISLILSLLESSTYVYKKNRHISQSYYVNDRIIFIHRN